MSSVWGKRRHTYIDVDQTEYCGNALRNNGCPCCSGNAHFKIENQYQNRVNEEELEEYDFLKEVTQQEVSRILYDAVDKLPSQTRSIILLNLKGFNNTEVAERLGVSVNTIKSLKKSAYVTLRTLLSKDLLMILFVLVDK